MKKILYLMMAATFIVMGCSKSDDNDSDYSVPSKLQGVWSGSEASNSHNHLILTLLSDGTANLIHMQQGETKIDLKGVKWAYKSAESTLVVGSTEGRAYHYAVSGFTGSSMNLTINTTSGGTWTFRMSLHSSGSGSSDDGGSSGSSGGSSSGGKKKECHYCMGTGDCREATISGVDGCWGDGECAYCNGSGWYRENKVGCSHCAKKGGVNTPGNGKCGICGGSGKCKHCGGSGYQ